MELFIYETSPALLDLVTQFFSQLLKKDPNSSYYLSQWGSFRHFLSVPPVYITSALSYISNIVPPYFLSSPDFGSYYTDEMKFQLSENSFNILSDIQNEGSQRSLESPIQPIEENVQKKVDSLPDENLLKPANNIEFPQNLVFQPLYLANNFSSSNNDYGLIYDNLCKDGLQSPREDVSNDSTQETSTDSFKGGDYLNLPGVPKEETAVKKYSMNKLLELAKKFKEGAENRNKELLAKLEERPVYLM